MSREQEFICGLSREVTIAVLPRLNMEELMFELNRRIQTLDNENSVKDRLVSILRDVMLEEYRQWKRKAEVRSSDETTISVQETVMMQENVLTAYTETILPETASPDASQKSSGLHILIKKERDTSTEVFMHAKKLEMDSDQIQLNVSEQGQLCNIPNPGSPTIPSSGKPMTQTDTTADSCIKEKDNDMLTEDEAVRACQDELNIQTPISSTQVLDAQKPMSTSRTEKTVDSDTPSACCHLPPQDGDVHMKREFHVSDDDQVWQISQTEHYTDERDTVLIKSGHEQSTSRKDYSEETPLASCQPTQVQDCENMAFLSQDNDSQIDNRRHVCDMCGFNTTNAHYLSQHRKRHKEEKPFMCGECGYRARHKYRLVGHMRTHTDEKPFKCNHCNYKTSHKRYLVEHMKTHSDAKPYICEICDYRTFKKSRLETHMMCHSDVKPYKCEECDYRTSRHSHVTRHMRLHTGERPYSCQECDYKAKEKAKLNRHIRVKHPRDCQKSKQAK